ncbi:MAG: hypothetical protein IJY94_06695 [Clostridia bacterium]|nr:hypothetical protein [Clostridia bacterium]
MKTFVLFELIILFEFLPAVLAVIFGFKTLWLLPIIACDWILLVRAFMREEKKKARRVRADGHSNKINFAETIIQQNSTPCQEEISRLQKNKRREVFIYE